MWFAIGSQHLWCRGSQPKHVSNSVLKEIDPHFMYERQHTHGVKAAPKATVLPMDATKLKSVLVVGPVSL